MSWRILVKKNIKLINELNRKIMTTLSYLQKNQIIKYLDLKKYFNYLIG